MLTLHTPSQLITRTTTGRCNSILDLLPTKGCSAAYKNISLLTKSLEFEFLA